MRRKGAWNRGKGAWNRGNETRVTQQRAGQLKDGTNYHKVNLGVVVEYLLCHKEGSYLRGSGRFIYVQDARSGDLSRGLALTLD